jgi:hypothetical protein
MPIKQTLNKHLTSKLQVSPNFTLDSVADSNYRGKCDVGGFLIFEWTLGPYVLHPPHYVQNAAQENRGILNRIRLSWTRRSY